ncbi:MAG: hypothetical protein ACPG06_07515 [Alphaproteobacteria bacterium]
MDYDLGQPSDDGDGSGGRGGFRIMRALVILALVLMIIQMIGCAFGGGSTIDVKSANAATLAQAEDRAARALVALRDDLNANRIANAVLLKEYARILVSENPDKAAAATALGNPAAMADYLDKRFSAAQSNQDGWGEASLTEEYIAIADAANREAYNAALVDPLNALAGLSNGRLERVTDETAGEADTTPGATLVGNPAYGSWQQDHRGWSFWQWYGAYRLFGDLFMGPVYYHRWHYRRPWSYYGDIGRGRYGARRDRLGETTRMRNSADRINRFGRETGRNPSSYGTRSTPRAKGAASSTRFSSTRSRSSYAGMSSGTSRATSRYSGGGSRYGASTRTGTRSGSRFGGK